MRCDKITAVTVMLVQKVSELDINHDDHQQLAHNLIPSHHGAQENQQMGL